ncbi:MAG TPA: site-specific integrase [Ktedonobacterales bacterium]|nr:site-specific integrase [Ktedonobacterales bacterium]
MNLADAYLEFTLAKVRSPASTHWYESRLTSYFAWLQEQGAVDVEGITLSLTRRYVEARRRTSA